MTYKKVINSLGKKKKEKVEQRKRARRSHAHCSIRGLRIAPFPKKRHEQRFEGEEVTVPETARRPRGVK